MQVYGPQLAAGSNPQTSVETVVLTVAGVFIENPNQRVFIDAWAAITPGTATTALRYRLRRGTDATGTLLGIAVDMGLVGAVGTVEDHEIMATDTPPEGGPYSYVLTVAQISGTANGVCNAANMQVLVVP